MSNMCPEASSNRRDFESEVATRFGTLPNFFCTAAAAPGLMEQLWSFAKSAYLGNPLRSIFKERLIVHLSQFYEARYCIVRHVGFLVGLGRMTTTNLRSKPARASRPLLLRAVVFASLLACAGCSDFLRERDRDIQNATQALEAARDDAQRAKAYSSRGTAYSEKARYSRATKRIASDEYERLFGLAIKDHNEAVRLNPGSAEVYFNRAQTYYDRATWDSVEGKKGRNTWFDAAAQDFQKAIEKDPHNSLAFDRLGLTYEQNGEADKAIQAYTREIAFDSFGKQRLADLYCNIGLQHEQHKDFAGAKAAYRKSIAFGVADDKSCPVEPSANLKLIEREKNESARTN
jgi:tetratricopeptide (TPR) repeat protein